jgi:hypothetical protein
LWFYTANLPQEQGAIIVFAFVPAGQKSAHWNTLAE